MGNPITILREVITEKEVAIFWEQLHTYHKRDIFPDPEDEDREYFLNDPEYREKIEEAHNRSHDRCFYLFFSRGGQDIGFAMPVIFTSEDGKCLIMEFCVFPEFRGNGLGTECVNVLLDWAKKNGAQYAELNYGNYIRRKNFWTRVGFVENGVDEWGEPLMIRPPADDVPITIEILADSEDWQLQKLVNSFLKEIGEQALTEEKQEQLIEAVSDGRITFFFAKRGYRAIGMCSVVKCFSTFTCADIGVFEDFYVEPAFRHKGIARMLAHTAHEWSREQKLSSLTVCCAPCDEAMYRHLGFDILLGKTYAKIN